MKITNGSAITCFHTTRKLNTIANYRSEKHMHEIFSFDFTISHFPLPCFPQVVRFHLFSTHQRNSHFCTQYARVRSVNNNKHVVRTEKLILQNVLSAELEAYERNLNENSSVAHFSNNSIVTGHDV